jgi:competence protein ComEC
MKRGGVYFLFIIFGLFLIFIYFFLISEKKKDLEIYFLDVGQGDSILIKTVDNFNILIDGGPDKKVLNGLSKHLSWFSGKIDLLILTHPHDDHVAGLIDVLDRYKIKQIFYTGVVHNSPAYLEWLNKVKINKIPVNIIDCEQEIVLNNLKLNFIYPNKSLLNKKVDNLNNSSIVFKLSYFDFSILLAGDAEQEIEKILINEKIDLKAKIFKASHHGSETANSLEFLKVINPEVFIIQVGKENKFNHPSLRVLKRVFKKGIKVFRNDLDGEIKILVNRDNYRILKENIEQFIN